MNYIIKGRVIKGEGYGKKIGFPTANLSRNGIHTEHTEALPPYGVYAGFVFIGTKNYRAGIVIGPLDRKGLPKIEAHLVGFKGNLYGKKIILHLNKFLRKFRKFETERELIIQIKKDLEKCK